MLSQNSSTRLCFSNSCTSLLLPQILRSGPSEFLTLSISATLVKNFTLLQSDLVTVLDKTYLVTSLTPGHWSACWGQYDSNILKVFRPSSRSAGASCFCITPPDPSLL